MTLGKEFEDFYLADRNSAGSIVPLIETKRENKDMKWSPNEIVQAPPVPPASQRFLSPWLFCSLPSSLVPLLLFLVRLCLYAFFVVGEAGGS